MKFPFYAILLLPSLAQSLRNIFDSVILLRRMPPVKTKHKRKSNPFERHILINLYSNEPQIYFAEHV